MDTATMKLFHDDIVRIQRLCPLPIRLAKMEELKMKRENIYAEIDDHGICPSLEEQRQKIEISIKILSLFIFGVNFGEKH